MHFSQFCLISKEVYDTQGVLYNSKPTRVALIDIYHSKSDPCVIKPWMRSNHIFACHIVSVLSCFSQLHASTGVSSPRQTDIGRLGVPRNALCLGFILDHTGQSSWEARSHGQPLTTNRSMIYRSIDHSARLCIQFSLELTWRRSISGPKWTSLNRDGLS